MVSTMDSLLGGGNHDDFDIYGDDATCTHVCHLSKIYKKNINPKMKIIVKCLSASNLGGNPYYNYLISAAVEIPGEIPVLCLLYLSVVFVFVFVCFCILYLSVLYLYLYLSADNK